MIIAVLIPIILGVLLIVIGLLIKNKPKGEVKNGIYTEAIVVDFAEKIALLHKVEYIASAPIVSFETENGRVRAIYPYFVNKEALKIKRGDTIKICYDKNNYNKFHIENDESKSVLSYLMTFVGVFIIIAEIILILDRI